MQSNLNIVPLPNPADGVRIQVLSSKPEWAGTLYVIMGHYITVSCCVDGLVSSGKGLCGLILIVLLHKIASVCYAPKPN